MLSVCLSIGLFIVAFVVAVTSPVIERQRILPCCIAVLSGWLWYISAWLVHSPAVIIHHALNTIIQPWELWAAADAIIGFFVFTKAYDRAWGTALFMLFIIQEIIHLGYGDGSYGWDIYRSMLDTVFWIEMACLIVGGCNNVRRRLDRCHAWWRSHMGSVRNPSCAKEVGRG
jgi:hypothetical protein